MNSTTSISISQTYTQCKDFDFDSEETDWTFDQVEENTGSAKRVKEICAHESRFDIQTLGNSESSDSFCESFIEPSFSFELQDFNDSGSSKSLNKLMMYYGEEVKRLTTISECPSCDELSSYEDSCNCLSTLGCDSNFLYIKKANTVKSDNVKTLGEVQIRFKQTECSSPSSPSLSR